MRRAPAALLCLAVLAAGCSAPAAETERTTAPLPAGVVSFDTVTSTALEGNPLGDTAAREVAVYLPPGYAEASGRRFPVVYLLHGFDGDARQFLAPPFSLAGALDSLIVAGAVRPTIVVTPDGRNRLGGSFFADAPATGRWGTFVAEEVVAHVDREYRTLADAEHRGIAGWSMGGLAALHLAMRHPERFGAVYALSPCCLDGPALLDDYGPEHSAWGELLALREPEEAALAGFHARLLLAAAAAVSPEGELPLFPAVARDLLGAASVDARLAGHLPALRRLRGIGFDAGSDDGFRHIPAGARRLSEALTAAGIPHRYEAYRGTHGSRVPERLRRVVLPFFSDRLGKR